MQLTFEIRAQSRAVFALEAAQVFDTTLECAALRNGLRRRALSVVARLLHDVLGLLVSLSEVCIGRALGEHQHARHFGRRIGSGRNDSRASGRGKRCQFG